MGGRPPGPTCAERSGPGWIDDGTLCRDRSAVAAPESGAVGERGDSPVLYSPAVKVAVDIPFAIAPGMTWDGFWRLIYDRANEALQKQAELLLKRGNITRLEYAELVNARNKLVVRLRNQLSPFGELYSELLKPASSLKTGEQFLKQKGSIEAVLRSVGRTRQVVNRIGVVSRVAGPASIVLELTMTAIVIQQAAPEDRSRVASREIGGAVGSVGFGLAGMWAGCAGAAALASPSLVVPIVGEVSTGGACLVGGILGGIGVGWLGRKAGEAAGEGLYEIYTEVSDFRWVSR